MDLLNLVVAEQGHRSHKGLGSGLRLPPQETDCQMYTHTLEGFWTVL